MALNVLTAFHSSFHKVGKFDITYCIVKFKNDGIEHLLLLSDTRLHQGVDISKLNKQQFGIKNLTLWAVGGRKFGLATNFLQTLAKSPSLLFLIGQSAFNVSSFFP